MLSREARAKNLRYDLERDLELHTVDGVASKLCKILTGILNLTIVIPHEFRAEPEALGQIDGNAETPHGGVCIKSLIIKVNFAFHLAEYEMWGYRTEFVPDIKPVAVGGGVVDFAIRVRQG